MRKISSLLGVSLLGFICVSFVLPPFANDKEEPIWNNENSLSELLFALGEPTPKHFVLDPSEDMVEKGRQIVLNGVAEDADGKKPSHQSKHYNCTSCHNIVKEDPNLELSDPEARLEFAIDNDIPFLQGTTLYGTVNRENWYNGDYYKKYGSLVEKANADLTEAIQLCALECSQGRALEQWEMDAVLAYLWSIDLKIGDLDLTDEEWVLLRDGIRDTDKHDEAIYWLKNMYLKGSPATFVDMPASKEEGYKDIVGNPENGKVIYQKSCQHCHRPNGESQLVLADNRFSLKYLKRHVDSYGQLSLYHALRIGTKPYFGHKPYMPHYTKERMSNQQLEDLRAYIERGRP